MLPTVLLILCSGLVIFTIFRTGFRYIFLIILLILLIRILLTEHLGLSNTIGSFLKETLTLAFFGPVFYLFLKRCQKNYNLSKKAIILNLILPLLLAVLNFYNVFLLESPNTVFTIAGNALVGLLNMIYTIVCFSIFIKMEGRGELDSKFFKVIFILCIIIYLFISSIMPFVSALYFTDDIDLVNLSVTVPRMYNDYIGLYLITAVAISAIIYNIRNYGLRYESTA